MNISVGGSFSQSYYHPGNRSGYIVFLICHVTSWEHMFKGLCEFVSGSLAKTQHPPIFGIHWSSVSRDIKNLIYHITSQNLVIEGSCNFLSCRSSWYNHLAKFSGHRHCGNKDIMFLVRHVI